jgi:hypothetical protein
MAHHGARVPDIVAPSPQGAGKLSDALKMPRAKFYDPLIPLTRRSFHAAVVENNRSARKKKKWTDS